MESTTYFQVENGIITNAVVATQKVAEQIGLMPYVEGLWIGDKYVPPAPQPDEITLLKAQVAMLEAQQTFLEDCLLEMADEVYA